MEKSSVDTPKGELVAEKITSCIPHDTLYLSDDVSKAEEEETVAPAQRPPRRRKWGTTRATGKKTINVSAETLKVRHSYSSIN